MIYTPDELATLMTKVEEQGGVHLDEQCVARTFEWTGTSLKPQTLPGCGNYALFEVPYENEPRAGEDTVTEGHLTVCAVDDNMGLWPRFAGTMGA